jgi:hypothetical protein
MRTLAELSNPVDAESEIDAAVSSAHQTAAELRRSSGRAVAAVNQ